MEENWLVDQWRKTIANMRLRRPTRRGDTIVTDCELDILSAQISKLIAPPKGE